MGRPTDVWTELSSRVRAFVGRRVNDPHAADDITQDVMLKAQLKDVPPEERLAAWAFAIARNAVIDHYRARVVHDHADVADLDGADDTEEVERTRTVRGLGDCLVRMVEHLPQPYREAIRLADFDGLTQKEVAVRAGISLSGAKSRVQRGRRQMETMLLDCCRVERDGGGNVIGCDPTARSGHYCGGEGGEPMCRP